MDDDDEEDESDDAIPEEAVIDKFLDMSTYIEPRSGKQAELIQFMKVMRTKFSRTWQCFGFKSKK